MKQYIYLHTMYGYTNIVQTKANVKLQINLTLAGYLLYLGIKNVTPGTKVPYIMSV